MDTDLRDGAVDEAAHRTSFQGKCQSELKQQTLPGESERVCEFRTLSLYFELRRGRRYPPGTPWGPSADRTPRFRPRSACGNHSPGWRRNERRRLPLWTAG